MKHDTPDNSTDCPTPGRLLAAADAILRAESHPRGTVTMWRDDGRPARQGFSSHELVEAMMFLRRLGLVTEEADNSNRRHGGEARP